jgi:GNAT superfamily N-acetyltransferase
MVGYAERRRRDAGRDSPRARGSWRRLWDAARHGDFARVAIVMSRRFGLGLVTFERLRILKRWAWTSPGGLRPIPGLAASTAACLDLPRLRAAFPHNAREYGARLRRGDRCVVLSRSDQPLAMTWVRLDHSRLAQSGCRIRLPAGACWIYDTFVTPAARGLGLFHTLMGAAFAEVRRLRLTWTLLAVHHENLVSVRAHERAGYEPCVELSTLNVGLSAWHRLKWPSGRTCWRRGSPWSQPDILLAT